MKPNAAEVAAAALENSSVPQTLPVGPSVFLWTPSTQQLALPNPCCHGSQQVQTSSVVVIVESHTASVNTDLLLQDWSCEFWGDWRRIKRTRFEKKQKHVCFYDILCRWKCHQGCGLIDVTFAKNRRCMEAFADEVRKYQNNHGIRTFTCMFKPAENENIRKENYKEWNQPDRLHQKVCLGAKGTLVCDSVSASEQASPTRLMWAWTQWTL